MTTRQKRPTMPNLNAKIHRAVVEDPRWLASVYARLDGHPDPDKCWIWTGGKHDRGYGRVRLSAEVGSSVAATHRIVWIAQRGPIPAGWVLDHDGDGCGNRLCANPGHVACVPELVNVHTGDSQWGINARKTHCIRGHALAGDNLIPSDLKRGQRGCRACHRQRVTARKAIATRARP